MFLVYPKHLTFLMNVSSISKTFYTFVSGFGYIINYDREYNT